MKKITLLFLFAVFTFAITACDFPGGGVGDTTYRITLTSSQPTAVLARSHFGDIEPNTTVTISADDVIGYRFIHWLDLDTDTVFSTAQSHSFSITKNMSLKAVYDAGESGTLSVTLTSQTPGVTLDKSPDDFVSLDTTMTIIAYPLEGYRFDHWYDQDTMNVVSISSTFSFSVTRNRNLEAVYLEEGTYGVYLLSNIDEAALTQSGPGSYISGETVQLSADAPENFIFVHWFDYYQSAVISTDALTTVTIEESRHLVAVYEYPSGTETYYQTGFENNSKTSYALQTLTVEDRALTLDDALIGTSVSDFKNGSRSVRLRDGSITTEFNVPFLNDITFLLATYSGDSHEVLHVEVSIDQSHWITLDSFTSTSSLQEHSVTLPSNFYTLHGGSSKQGVYVRLIKSGENRVNVDDFVITISPIVRPELPQDRFDDDIRFPNNSTRLQLTFDNLTHFYSYGDEWLGASCTVLDLVTEEQKACLRYGAVNTNRLGEYDVIYYAIDDDGFTASQTFTKVVLRDATLLDYTYDSYYEGINGLYGEDLLLALRIIIQNNVTLQTYDAARQILEIVDRDPQNDNNVLLIYNRASVNGTWDAGSTWNREHVWPNSRLGIPRVSGSQRNIGTDLHNLRAANPSVNSSRGNKLFGYTETASTYYPGEDRGDVARIYFYMVTMWNDLVLSDEFPDSGNTYTVEGAIHGLLSVLIDFHFDDAVDAFEYQRNTIIYSYQNNRNPFIDYPHLVELIWFDHENIPLPS